MGNKTDTHDLPSLNLSDFAFFQAVMKNKDAYRDVLSIILNEPDIELEEVRVEEVILNEDGKKAIRLDAWSRAADHRQFDIEMQNDTEHDNQPMRSRFYQGMMDTPVLKSGKDTKYRNLPPTVIIFITKEDIFKRDRVIYTFEETCTTLPDLKLNDGTQKIFLNMQVKDGDPTLVSLLQYLGDTRIDNPDVVIKDKRILELNEIVTEVKTSEEWEEQQMSILSIGLERGQARGEELKLIKQVCRKLSKSKTPVEIAEDLEEDPLEIERICVAAAPYAPDYDSEAIYNALQK